MKRYLVTGANSGIGKQTALGLAKQQAEVIMVCRDQARGEEARQEIIKATGNQNVHLMLCDLASMASIREFGQAVQAKYDYIDVLVNNAGAMFGERQESVDGLELTFALNHIGYFLPTHYLLPLLRKGQDKRIVSVSSMAHQMVRRWDVQDYKGLSYNQWAVYGFSKLCNILFTRQLAKMVKAEGITVNCLHPGVVATNFGQSGSRFIRWMVKLAAPLLTKAQDGASTSLFLATSPSVAGVTGEYFSNSKVKATTKIAQDPKAMQELWDLSLKLTGIEQYGQ